MSIRKAFDTDTTSAWDREFPATAWRSRDDDDPVGALWRGAQIFRMLGFLYALSFNITINDELSRPAVVTMAGIGVSRCWSFYRKIFAVAI